MSHVWLKHYILIVWQAVSIMAPCVTPNSAARHELASLNDGRRSFVRLPEDMIELIVGFYNVGIQQQRLEVNIGVGRCKPSSQTPPTMC